MVTSLLLVGDSAAVAPMSFSGARNCAWPLSPKMVGHGARVVHGSGAVMLVMTSETSVVAGVPACAAPRIPCSESITRNTGELPWRTTSPHETLAAIIAVRTISRVAMRMSSSTVNP